ncbi:MAG: putative protein-disulfide isomerase, partial [Saprospiraceae bacterium]
MDQKKLNIIYFADPMCSTCYGFSPTINKIEDDLEGLVDIQMIMGGLRPFNTETMKDLGVFLQKEWRKVQQISGQFFKYDLLNDHSFVYDTEPASRAVITMRKLAPEFTFLYFKALQKAFYAENKDITNTTTLIELAAKFDINYEVFKTEFVSENLRRITLNEFDYSSKLGVTSFPTIGIQREEQITILAKG